MTTYECEKCGHIEILHCTPEWCALCGYPLLTNLDALTQQGIEAEKIGEQNDAFRRGERAAEIAGQTVITNGIASLGREAVLEIIQTVREFENFPQDDPCRHDFGLFDHAKERIYWKIDLYDPHYHHGSEAPTDPARTRRVLTIMLAREY